MSKHTLYIGSFQKSDTAPIHRCEFDNGSGEISLGEVYYDTRPSWLCKAKESNKIFFVREAENIGDAYGGGIGCFFDETQSPVLSNIGASGPCHLCEDGGNLYLACYREGALVQLKWLYDGFSQDVKIIRHEGKSVNPMRQNQAHPHFSLFTPDGKFLVVCDLGLDKILLYPYEKEKGIVGEAITHSAPEGSGPRHAVFSRDGRYLFVVTEMGGTVLSYQYDGLGGLVLVSELDAMPKDALDGEVQCAAIRLSPDGNELIVTERRSGSIVFFAIGKNGSLLREGAVRSAACPRDAVFSPDGKWLLVACQQADVINVYSYVGDISVPVSSRVRLMADCKLSENSAPCCLLFV